MSSYEKHTQRALAEQGLTETRAGYFYNIPKNIVGQTCRVVVSKDKKYFFQAGMGLDQNILDVGDEMWGNDMSQKQEHPNVEKIRLYLIEEVKPDWNTPQHSYASSSSKITHRLTKKEIHDRHDASYSWHGRSATPQTMENSDD